MGEIRTKALVIRQTEFGEGNRMLTLFSEDFGLMKAAIYGVKRAKSRSAAASQFLSWSEFILFRGKGEIMTVNSVTAIDAFFPMQESIELLSLGAYFAEITTYFMGYEEPNPPLLRLLLNTLYACSYQNLSLAIAKIVYELRLICMMGYAPHISECAACGETGNIAWFSAECGGILCNGCHAPARDDLPLSPAAYQALFYILTAEEKRVFSFRISDNVQTELLRLCEQYLLHCAETEFSSLSYLKNVCDF